MRRGALVITSLVLFLGSATATGFLGGPQEPGKMPSRLIRFEALAVGLQLAKGSGLAGITTRVARVTYVGGRLRVGAALADGIDLGSPGAIPELHVGYNLLSKQKRAWFFYSAVPELYVEAAGGFVGTRGPFYGKLSACCEVDYHGLGASIETGVVVWLSDVEGWSESSLFAGFRLRLLAFGIGF
jgi:hypothetical protein